MTVESVQPKFVWLLGQEPKQRLNLRFWLFTSATYCLLLALQLATVFMGLVEARHALATQVLIAIGVFGFYVAMRSGWSQRFDDPALTSAQMAFAISMLALAHVLVPKLPGMLMMVTPMVLLFGAFTLTPIRCRQMGWFAVLMQGLVLGWSASPLGGSTHVQVDGMFFLVSAVVFPIVGILAGRLSTIRTQLRDQKRDLHEALRRNQLLARLDDLTGLPNRRHAQELLAYEERRAHRQQVPPSVCIIDIDHFKVINDTYGHAAGDDVLRLLAHQASTALRTTDLLARWGGEEFVLLMPETPLPEAAQLIERLRRHLAQPHIWPRAELKVTFSAGLASHLTNETMEHTIARADVALYQAKTQGRNRTALA